MRIGVSNFFRICIDVKAVAVIVLPALSFKCSNYALDDSILKTWSP